MRTLCKTILAAAFAAVLSANATDVSVASFCERANKGDRLTVAFLGGDAFRATRNYFWGWFMLYKVSFVLAD